MSSSYGWAEQKTITNKHGGQYDDEMCSAKYGGNCDQE